MTEIERELLKDLLEEVRAIRKILNNGQTISYSEPQQEKTDKSELPPPLPRNKEMPPLNDNNTSQTGGSIGENIRRYYFGAPDDGGFDECNVIADPANPRVLYVVETQDGKNGNFYPLGRSLGRLKSNAKAFLLPFCNFSGSLDDIQSLDIPKENFGEVELENGFWRVVKKCVL